MGLHPKETIMNSQHQVKVSLNRKWHNVAAKPGGDGFDWTAFTNNFAMEDLSLSEVAELCRHNVPLCNPFNQVPVADKDTCRHVSNMVQYSFFQEDIDKGFDLPALSQDAFVQQYGTLIFSSFRWQLNKPRGKVLYFLQEPNQDAERARFFARAILWYRQRITNPDPTVKDPLRFAFTCNPDPNRQETLLLGNLLPPKLVDSIMDAYRAYLTKVVQANEKKRGSTKVRKQHVGDAKYRDGIDFYNKTVDCYALAESCGYTPCGNNRLTRPAASIDDVPTPGGLVLLDSEQGTFYFTHSSNDPVSLELENKGWNNTECFTPFIMVAILKYGGDFKKAYAKEVDGRWRYYKNVESEQAQQYLKWLENLAQKFNKEEQPMNTDTNENTTQDNAPDGAQTDKNKKAKKPSDEMLVEAILQCATLLRDSNGQVYIALAKLEEGHGHMVPRMLL